MGVSTSKAIRSNSGHLREEEEGDGEEGEGQEEGGEEEDDSAPCSLCQVS